MNNVFLIGGGEINVNPQDSETLDLDLEILKSIPSENQTKPIVFIGAASNDAPGYFDTFREYYRALCERINFPSVDFVFLKAEASPEVFSRTIQNSSLVYLGGGETKALLSALEKWQAKSVFRQALKSGVVFAGISAGAYALAAKSIHVDHDDLELNDGLGLVPVICQAHATSDAIKKAESYLADSLEKLPFLPLVEGQMQGFKV